MRTTIGIVLACALMAPAAMAAPSCDDALAAAKSWHTFAGYLEKLQKDGLDENEIAYIDDVVREREADLAAMAKGFQKSEAVEEKAMGQTVLSHCEALGALEGKALATKVQRDLPALLEGLDAIVAHCVPPEDEEED